MLKTVKEFVDKQRLLEKQDRILLAVSGGPDSMALLHIMSALQEKLRLKIGVAHLNHQLRPEAAAEQQYLQKYCQAQDIIFYSRSVDVAAHARREKKSLEEAGRDQRYRFFTELLRQFDWQKIATAHHKDDRAETVLLHLLRGSGVKGLRSIMPVSGPLIRPLLTVSKAEILVYLDLHGLTYFVDESNYDLSYLRNRVRHELLPLLQTYNPQIVSGLNQLADIAAEENRALERENDLLWAQLIISEQKDKIILNSQKLQEVMPAYQRRLVQKALARLKGASDWGMAAIDYVLDLAAKPGSDKRVNLPQGVLVSKQYGELVFSLRQRQEKSFCHEIYLPGSVSIEETGEIFSFTIVARENFQPAAGETYLDYDKMEPPLFLRSRLDGDRFAPAGMQGSKKLKDYFIDIKLPAAQRNLVPVLASGQQIYALLGYRLARNAMVDSATRNILVVKNEKIKKLE